MLALAIVIVLVIIVEVLILKTVNPHKNADQNSQKTLPYKKEKN